METIISIIFLLIAALYLVIAIYDQRWETKVSRFQLYLECFYYSKRQALPPWHDNITKEEILDHLDKQQELIDWFFTRCMNKIIDDKYSLYVGLYRYFTKNLLDYIEDDYKQEFIDYVKNTFSVDITDHNFHK